MSTGTQNPIESLLPLLQRVRPRPGHDGEYTASCPCARHERGDQDPSLSIRVGTNGAVLLNCFSGGCTAKEIMEAVGKTLADLFPRENVGRGTPNGTRNGTARKKGKSYPSQQEAIAAAGRGILNDHPGATFAGSWAYHDAAGKVAFAVARWNRPGDDGRKEFRPFYPDVQGWRIGDPPGKLPLYRLTQLLAAGRSAVAHVAEGEGKTELLASLGLLATTSAHGANSAGKTDWTPLAGWEVYLYPDADEAGEVYAAQVAAILGGLNPPARVKIVRLPGLEPGSGDDIKEWVARRREDGKDDDAIRAEIEALGHAETEKKPDEPPLETKDEPPRTIVEVIRAYMRMRYDPTFRRGANIWAELLGREVTRGEACAAPTSEIIPALLAATDFPRGEAGPKRSVVPSQYRQWAPIAWADLLDELEDEADSPEIADTAGEQFRGTVTDLLLTIESISYKFRTGNEDRQEVQRRSLIDWCCLFAKRGRWMSIRSHKLWCKRDEDGQLQVAMHRGLFAQVRRTCPATSHRKFADLCELYEVGVRTEKTKTSNSRFVILTPKFLAGLIETPGDGICDDDGGAAFTHARANVAPPVAPQVAPQESQNGVTEEP